MILYGEMEQWHRVRLSEQIIVGSNLAGVEGFLGKHWNAVV
jgi:hypothetical protein